MRYFKQHEFDSPDAIGSGIKMKQSTLLMIDECRHIAKIPFHVTSGYRTKAHNISVGGKNGSSHCKGRAVDVRCNNSKDRFTIVNAALKVGFTRIGINGNFIHLDNDNQKVQNVIWTY